MTEELVRLLIRYHEGDEQRRNELLACRCEEARTALAESGVSSLPDRAAPEIVAAERLSAELA
jgi:hypothetical protein